MKFIPKSQWNREVDHWRMKVEQHLESTSTAVTTLGHSIITLSSYDPQDGTSIYAGQMTVVPGTTETSTNLTIFANSTLTKAFISWDTAGASGSADVVTVTFRLNGAASTTLASLSRTDVTKQYSNTGLGVAVVMGDYFQILVACPTWPVSPSTVSVDWVVYFE